MFRIAKNPHRGLRDRELWLYFIAIVYTQYIFGIHETAVLVCPDCVRKCVYYVCERLYAIVWLRLRFTCMECRAVRYSVVFSVHSSFRAERHGTQHTVVDGKIVEWLEKWEHMDADTPERIVCAHYVKHRWRCRCRSRRQPFSDNIGKYVRVCWFAANMRKHAFVEYHMWVCSAHQVQCTFTVYSAYSELFVLLNVFDSIDSTGLRQHWFDGPRITVESTADRRKPTKHWPVIDFCWRCNVHDRAPAPPIKYVHRRDARTKMSGRWNNSFTGAQVRHK